MQRNGQWAVQEVEEGVEQAQVGGMGQEEEGVQEAQGKRLLDGEKVLLEGEVCTVCCANDECARNITPEQPCVHSSHCASKHCNVVAFLSCQLFRAAPSV